jgi:O-antigen ligase
VYPTVRSLSYITFFLSPLAYSQDGDSLRAYWVVLIALVFTGLFLRPRIRSIEKFEPGVVLIYSFMLIIQQMIIAEGDLIFGLKFFVATVAAFFPFWILRSTHCYVLDVVTLLRRSIDILFFIVVLQIFSSFFFGFGERYVGGVLGFRAFGIFGDSFTPVITFLLLYFWLDRKWIYTTLALACLLMTGGKMGIFMAVAMFAIYFSLFSRSAVKPLFLITGMLALGATLVNPFWVIDIFSGIENFEFALNNRLFSFQVGWTYFQDNPILGIGINEGLNRVREDTDLLADSLRIVNYFSVGQVHNAYLRTLSETGLIGFCLLLMLVFYWVRGAVRALRVSRSLPMCLERTFLIAAGIWVICFVLVYQTTGWFENGHPQLAWLLMLSTFNSIILERTSVKMRSTTSWQANVSGGVSAK